MKNETLMCRAKALKLYGLLSHWEEIEKADWIEPLIEWEENQRSHEAKHGWYMSHLGRFKLLSEFDWTWPKKCR